MSADFEVHPIGTAEKLLRIETNPLPKLIAKLNSTLTSQLEAIRELSDKLDAAASDEDDLTLAERALRDFWGLNPIDATRYARTALEAASARRRA